MTDGNRVERALDLFDRHVEELERQAGSQDFDKGYYLKHRPRFAGTLDLIAPAQEAGARALELGATDFLQVALRHVFGYDEVFGSVFSTEIERKYYHRAVAAAGMETRNPTFSVNLEHDLLPVPPEHFAMVLCCEVLEHMDIDPMFMLVEVNRVCQMGAELVLTTPNCCSARNFWKIAHGYRPHFFMQYERSRSPYRHNIEWDVHAVAQLARAAGFEPVTLETTDVFEAPMPEALALLARNGLTTDHRGDCIMLRARKVSGVVDRWPAGLYV
ncbi:class I SAM-dependent methyltransferase [Paracraurococcus ruber]|nr:methyltransferase domain-containing protein [Paracraurococcus ruber]